ncbi:MAG TPA: hypothetical protein VGQ51_18680 [Puia sp.]|jgi:hypothetical protein|nr:hypothetical protein [Puia sp.]
MTKRCLASVFFIALLAPGRGIHAQDNYEIQVYASPTVGKDTTMVELHSNYSFIGAPGADGVVSTNHMLRETIEITHGFTPWFEMGFYIFNCIGDMGRTNYVGSHLRPRVMAPVSWNWPVGVSVSFEGGFVKDGYDPDTWTLEIRPIIDKQLGPVYLALNPVVDLTFAGADKGRGVGFAPDFKFSYQIGKVWAPGIEYYGSLGPFRKFDPIDQQQHQLFIAVDADFDPRWEFNAGYGFGWGIDKSIFKVILGRRFGGGKHAHTLGGTPHTVFRF